MFDFFLRAVAEKYGLWLSFGTCTFATNWSSEDFSDQRQNEMEMAAAKEKKMATMKKNLKLLAVALVVLAIEKITEMMAGLFNFNESDGALVETKDDKCTCWGKVFENYNGFRSQFWPSTCQGVPVITSFEYQSLNFF